MKDSTRHTCIMIGIALIIFAVVLAYMGASGSRVYVDADSSTVPHSEYNDFTRPLQTTTIAQSQQSQAATEPNQSFKVNLNTATLEDLVSISGIGEKTAVQILSYRDEIGGFTSVEQLKEIRGIGDAKLAKIAPFVTV